MKGGLYAMLAKVRLLSRNRVLSPFRRLVAQVPLARRLVHWLERASRDLLVGDQARVWVQVQSGMAKGLWLHLDLRWEDGYWLGTAEASVHEILRSLPVPGAVFYDVGGHIGYYSFSVARQIGPGGRVFVFEADPDNVVRLREHAAMNDLNGRVQIINKAIWSQTREVSFKRSQRDHTQGGVFAGGHIAPFADGEVVVVPAITLDSFVEAGYPPPNFVKIDVEGAEEEVLKGAERIFLRVRPALLCEVHHLEAAITIESWLKQKQYSVTWLARGHQFPHHLVAQPGS